MITQITCKNENTSKTVTLFEPCDPAQLASSVLFFEGSMLLVFGLSLYIVVIRKRKIYKDYQDTIQRQVAG